MEPTLADLMSDDTPAPSGGKTRYEIAIDPPDGLTVKQRAMVEEYVKHGNMSEASRVAGYAAPAIGARQLKKPHVAAYLETIRAQLAPVVWDASEIINRIQGLAEKGHDNVKIRALELLAKTKALLTDKVKLELPRRILIRDPNNSGAYELGTKE